MATTQLALTIDTIGRQMLLPDDDPCHIVLVPDMDAWPWYERQMAIDVKELRRLAQLCEDQQCPIEAARIRRWLGEEPPTIAAVDPVRSGSVSGPTREQ